MSVISTSLSSSSVIDTVDCCELVVNVANDKYWCELCRHDTYQVVNTVDPRLLIYTYPADQTHQCVHVLCALYSGAQDTGEGESDTLVEWLNIRPLFSARTICKDCKKGRATIKVLSPTSAISSNYHLSCLIRKNAVYFTYNDDDYTVSTDQSGRLTVEQWKSAVQSKVRSLSMATPARIKSRQPQVLNYETATSSVKLCVKELTDLITKHTDVGLDMNYIYDVINPILQHIESGWTCGLLGMNGVGKSFLINLLLFLTQYDPITHAKPNNYVLEAVQRLINEEIISSPSNMTMSAHIKFFRISQEDAKKYNNNHAAEHQAYHRHVNDYFKGTSSISQSKAYLLPSQTGATVTTKFTTCIEEGQQVHALIEYYSEQEAKDIAYAYIDLMQNNDDDESDDDGTNSDAAKEILEMSRMRYEALTGNSSNRIKFADAQPTKQFVVVNGRTVIEEQKLDIIPPSDASQIELCTNVKQFVQSSNQYHVYVGVGWRSDGNDGLLSTIDIDRCYIRDVLSNITKEQSACVKNLTIYMPSQILSNYCKLLDFPGTNDADPVNAAVTMKALDTVDLLFVLPHGGKSLKADKITRSVLASSSFLRNKILKSNSSSKLVIAHYPESSLQLTPASICEQKRIDDDNIRNTESAKCVIDMITAVNKASDESNRFTDDELLHIINNTCGYMTIYPTLFASMLINSDERVLSTFKALKPVDLAFALERTKGYELLGQIRCFAPLFAKHILSQLVGTQTVDQPPLISILLKDAQSMRASLADKDNRVTLLKMRSIAQMLNAQLFKQRSHFKENKENLGRETERCINAWLLRTRPKITDSFNATTSRCSKFFVSARKVAMKEIFSSEYKLHKRNRRGVLSDKASGLHKDFPIRLIVFRYFADNTFPIEEVTDSIRATFQSLLPEIGKELRKWLSVFFQEHARSPEFQQRFDRVMEASMVTLFNHLVLPKAFSGKLSLEPSRLHAKLKSIKSKVIESFLLKNKNHFSTLSEDEVKKFLRDQIETIMNQVKNLFINDIITRVDGAIRTVLQLVVWNFKGNKAIIMTTARKFISELAAARVESNDSMQKLNDLISDFSQWSDDVKMTIELVAGMDTVSVGKELCEFIYRNHLQSKVKAEQNLTKFKPQMDASMLRIVNKFPRSFWQNEAVHVIPITHVHAGELKGLQVVNATDAHLGIKQLDAKLKQYLLKSAPIVLTGNNLFCAVADQLLHGGQPLNDKKSNIYDGEDTDDENEEETQLHAQLRITIAQQIITDFRGDKKYEFSSVYRETVESYATKLLQSTADDNKILSGAYLEVMAFARRFDVSVLVVRAEGAPYLFSPFPAVVPVKAPKRMLVLGLVAIGPHSRYYFSSIRLIPKLPDRLRVQSSTATASNSPSSPTMASKLSSSSSSSSSSVSARVNVRFSDTEIEESKATKRQRI